MKNPAAVTSPMRILSISNCPLNEFQGSGYIICGFAKRLLALGHEVNLIGPENYLKLPHLPGAIRMRKFIGYSIAAMRAVAKGSYDVVELWGAEGWWASKQIAKRSRRPVVVARSNGLESHRHQAIALITPSGDREKSNSLAQLFDRTQDIESAFTCPDLLTTVSYYDRRFALDRQYQTPDRILTLENPLEDEWLDQKLLADRPRVIGFVGSWTHVKGYDVLTASLPAVLREFSTWRVKLVGVGHLNVNDILPPDVAARVEIIPFVTDRNLLRKIYSDISVLVFPSRYDSFGLVAAEAMSCGCALLTSKTGFPAELRPEIEAVFVEGMKADAWSSALKDLLRNEARIRTVAAGGYARVQGLRWDAAVSRLVEAYEEVLRQRG